tara:strand:+ start:6901 stop:7947 length:1047 start_codon:yes stop_codon:yes gene_type:complete
MTDKTPVRFVNYSGMSMASHRYRTLMPAQLLDGIGYDVKICNAEDEARAGVYIFSKHFDPKQEYLFAKKLKDPDFVAGNVTSVIAGEEPTGNVIIFDICDNHFDNKNFADYYKGMVELADIVLVSTYRMAEVVKDNCDVSDKNLTVIEDSYEFPEREPRFNWEQKEVENVLWYGHPTNIKHLQRVWNDVGGYNLMIITKDGVKLDVDGKPFPVVPYSIDSLLWGFAQCDVTIIPNEGDRSVKGANRLIESVRQGVFVVAEPMPAYDEFKEWMYIGDIKEGLEWCKQNKVEMQGRIKEAQKYIAKTYSPAVTADQWSQLIEEAISIRNTSNRQKEKEKIASGKVEPMTV